MANRTHKPPYTAIAPFYNTIMEHVDYKGWGKYLTRIIKPFNRKDDIILELAGGTGSLIPYLKLKYQHYILSDLSYNMLSYAKSDKEKIAFDMKAIPIRNESVNLIVCTFDAINYILNQRDIVRTFKEVYRIMHPGAVFVFDIALEANSYEYEKYGSRALIREEGILEQHTWYNPKIKIHTNKFRIISLDGTTSWETHRQKIYPVDFFIRTVLKAGFEIISALDAFTEKPLKKKSLRAQFIIRKPNA